MTIAAVLFDLDGTLVDTAPDLVAVLNRLLLEQGKPPMPYAIARNEASHGALGLIRLGFGAELAAEERERLRGRFLELYAANICVKSRLFIDIERVASNVLPALRWGIVTNKPEAMTIALLERLGIADLAACIVGGDTLPQRKPHPAPLLHAAKTLGLDPTACVYIGDAARDIEAAHAAGMQTWAALWGYIRPSENPASWAADESIRHPRELGGILSRQGFRLAR